MANNTEQRVTSLEATVAEFVAQAARLLGDHGSRLSRNEAQLETLTALFQAADRRLNRLEETVAANSQAIGNLQQAVEGLREATQANTQNIQVLADLAQSNEVRFRQLTESQAGLVENQRQVLSRMDDLIAVVRERM